MLRHLHSRCVLSCENPKNRQRYPRRRTPKRGSCKLLRPAKQNSLPCWQPIRSHSKQKLDSTPIDSPRPPQPPAAWFKRPNRKCPESLLSQLLLYLLGHFRLSHSVFKRPNRKCPESLLSQLLLYLLGHFRLSHSV